MVVCLLPVTFGNGSNNARIAVMAAVYGVVRRNRRNFRDGVVSGKPPKFCISWCSERGAANLNRKRTAPRAGDDMKYGKNGSPGMVRTYRPADCQEDGLVASESQENLFITRWFAQVKKQRRFSRDVATDVDWILNQGRTLGVRARLRHKLDYLWRSCTGELSEQNDLFA